MANAAYRITRPDGSVEFTDIPAGPGQFEAVGSNASSAPSQGDADHKAVMGLISEVRKRIPKITDYLEYLDYLRHYRPLQFDRVMRELQREDPQTWLKLQKFPQFRTLREAAIGLKAGEKHIGAAIGAATGSLTGSAEKWLETTPKDQMKRDRYGPYADVLGNKATTLSALATPTYSTSRLGQFLQQNDKGLAQSSKAVAQDLSVSRAAVRAGFATAVSRAGTPVMDVLNAMLDPQRAEDIGVAVLNRRAQKMFELGIIDEEQWAQARELLGEQKRSEMRDFLDAAMLRWLKP